MSQIQARLANTSEMRPMILDVYPFIEKCIVYCAHVPPMILNGLFIKPSNITGCWMVRHIRNTT